METPEIDKAHFERLQAGAAMLLPKAALDGVSAMLRSKYRFLAWEDFEAQAVAAYGKNVPVTHVSVSDQAYFCNQKSKKEGLDEAMAPSNDIIELGYTEVTVQEYFNVMGTLPKSLLAYYAIEKRLIIESVVYEYKEESESRYKYSNSGDYSVTVQDLKSFHKKLEEIYLAFREQCYAEKELKELMAKAAQDAGSYWLRRMESNRFSSFEIACCLREDEMRHFCQMLSEKKGVLAVPTAQCNHGRFAYRLLAYERTGKDKAGYYLPSKAEWLYAANGGIDQQRFQYAGSNNLDTSAWYKDNSGGILHPVAQKQPNTIGLYDMCGNVRETVIDQDNIHFDAFGGSAYDDKENCILARNANLLHTINGQTGFRICANRRLK